MSYKNTEVEQADLDTLTRKLLTVNNTSSIGVKLHQMRHS